VRFNDNKGEISFFGQKMIILRRDVVRVMRDALERLVADQAAPFLSYLASGIGIHEGSIFRDSIAATGPEQRAALENLVHSAFEDTNLGLGKVRIRQIDFDRASASVAIGNCFEAMENGQSEEPNCMFTSGFLAGLFAEVLDKTVQARETKCISQGQPECEFEISLADSEDEEGAGAEEKEAAVEARSENTKPSIESVKPVTTPKSSENKPIQKPTASVEEPKTPAQEPGASQADMDVGVETASRIAKRKQGFWERHLKKKQ